MQFFFTLPHRSALLVCLGLSMLTNNSHAELISTINFQVRNTLFAVQGMLLGPPQPIAEADLRNSNDQGELLSYEGAPLAVFRDGNGVDGSGPTGPVPTVRVRAEATGRDFRVAAGLEYDRGSCPTPDCIYVNGTAVWQLNWNARGATRSNDTITIDAAGFDGLAGQFTLPIEMTGNIEVETDFRSAILDTGTNFSISSANAEGIRTANDSFSFNASNRPGGRDGRAIDTTTNFVVPFVFGETFSIGTSFNANVSVITGSTFLDELNMILVESDFFSTAHFDPFENFRVDSNGDGQFDLGLDTSLLNIASLLNLDYLALGGDVGGGDPMTPPITPPTAVPEPGTFWLSAFGVLALMRMRRRLPLQPARAIVQVCQKHSMSKQRATLRNFCAAVRAVRLKPLG